MKKVILLLLLGAWVFTSVAQEKVFQVNEVSVINYGDGRLLFRELNEEKTPLQGEYRIIDGYHSEYILASFKNGMYDGCIAISRGMFLRRKAHTRMDGEKAIVKHTMATAKPCRAKERSWKESCTVSVSHTIKMEKSKRRSAIKWETRTDATANTMRKEASCAILIIKMASPMEIGWSICPVVLISPVAAAIKTDC